MPGYLALALSKDKNSGTYDVLFKVQNSPATPRTNLFIDGFHPAQAWFD